MRTSAYQFEVMVTYMEEHGDLQSGTTNSNDPKNRIENLNRWEELSAMLNSDVGGDTRSSVKWKKVWSDLKNNTKKKLHRSQTLAAQGKESKLKMTELELRILRIIGIVIVTDDNETLEYPGSTSHDEETTERRPRKCRRDSTVYRLQSDDLDQDDENPEKRPKKYHRESTSNFEVPSADHNYHIDPPKPISDEYWRFFKVQQHKDNMNFKKEQLRIREMEVQAQLGWQKLGNKAIDLLDKLVEKYCTE